MVRSDEPLTLLLAAVALGENAMLTMYRVYRINIDSNELSIQLIN